jgi:hypothetical protein
VTFLRQLLLGKIVLPRSPGKSRFESAFHCISCQIVSGLPESSSEQSPGFPETKFGDFLEIDAVHALAAPLLLNRKLSYALLM